MNTNNQDGEPRSGTWNRLKGTSARMLRCQSGANAIEYGLLASLIAMAILASMQNLGGGLKGSWDSTAKKVSDTMK